MAARLGFAVIAHIEPDILLVDEVLSVGDAAFQAQCKRTMTEFKERGTTMFLVSHDLATVEQMCSQAIWIERGTMKAMGPATRSPRRLLLHLNGTLLEVDDRAAPGRRT